MFHPMYGMFWFYHQCGWFYRSSFVTRTQYAFVHLSHFAKNDSMKRNSLFKLKKKKKKIHAHIIPFNESWLPFVFLHSVFDNAEEQKNVYIYITTNWYAWETENGPKTLKQNTNIIQIKFLCNTRFQFYKSWWFPFLLLLLYFSSLFLHLLSFFRHWLVFVSLSLFYFNSEFINRQGLSRILKPIEQQYIIVLQ